MTARNVRLLCRCPVCGKLGDEQSMVKVGPMKTPAHDRCAFEQLGDGIMNLPQEERVKFSLVAVGPDMMRRLVDAQANQDVKFGTRSLRQCPISAVSMIARSALSPSSRAPSARR